MNIFNTGIKVTTDKASFGSLQIYVLFLVYATGSYWIVRTVRFWHLLIVTSIVLYSVHSTTVNHTHALLALGHTMLPCLYSMASVLTSKQIETMGNSKPV